MIAQKYTYIYMRGKFFVSSKIKESHPFIKAKTYNSENNQKSLLFQGGNESPKRKVSN